MRDAEDKSGRHNAEDHFLDRWSRRKAACREDEAAAEAQPAAQAPPRNAATTVESDPRQQLTDADMPPIDSLDSGSDFSVFMSPKVSEALRTRALRKLFHLPAFNVTDGLNDYDEDYTQFAGLGDVVTQEMKRMLRRELAAAEAIEDEAVPAVHDDASTVKAAGDTDPVEDPDEGPDKV